MGAFFVSKISLIMISAQLQSGALFRGGSSYFFLSEIDDATITFGETAILEIKATI